MASDIVLYLMGGAAAGLTAGLFGVGGGTVLVPLLLFMFHQQGMPDAYAMHMAVATSLSVIIVNAVASTRSHHARGAVRWSIFWRLLPGILAGTWLGAWAADRLSSSTLVLVFGVFLLAVSIQLLINRQPKPHRQVPGAAGLGLVGAVIGSVSALVGIGGGSMTVPYLMWCNVPASRAVGTAAAVGLPIAISGSAGFVVAGLASSGLPPSSLGYVYLPAFLGLALAGSVCAPLGARLAHRLPSGLLKRIFGVFLLLVSVKLLLGAN